MIEQIFTIGAYGFDASSFIGALKQARVDLFLDIRARCGMRGSKYAFANATRLEASLAQFGVRYLKAKELAPSEAVRDAQRTADARDGIAKRNRTCLSEAFKDAYNTQCLQDFDSVRFVESVCGGAKRPVFFCVESEPTACHRSLVASRLALDLNVLVEDIKPCG